MPGGRTQEKQHQCDCAASTNDGTIRFHGMPRQRDRFVSDGDLHRQGSGLQISVLARGTEHGAEWNVGGEQESAVHRGAKTEIVSPGTYLRAIWLLLFCTVLGSDLLGN